MRVISKPEHSSLEWQRLRHRDDEGRAIFGASEAASLMNRSVYENRADLILRKMGEPQTSEPSPAMMTGNLVEPILIQEASRRLTVEIVTPDFMFGKDRFVATPDGIDKASLMRLESNAAMKKTPDVWVEAKCTSRYRVRSEEEIPEMWRWQMSAQALITDAPIFLVVLDSALHINLIEFKRSAEAEDELMKAAEIIGSMIDKGEMPQDDLKDLSADQIASLWRASNRSVDLPQEALGWIEMLEESKEQKKEWERREETAKSALARLLLDADVGLFNGEPIVTWKEQAGRTSVDTKKLLEDHPILAEQYKKQSSPFRVMRTIKKKGTK